MDGVDLMVHEIQKAGQAVLLATGPLTNVAVAMGRAPELRTHLRRIVWMGGSWGFGNVTPAAEFNAWVDPDAARAVLRSGVPVTMIGLNVTHQVLIGASTVDSYRRMGNSVAKVAADMLDFYLDFHKREVHRVEAPIHDAVAAVEAAFPGVVATERHPVDVETTGELTTGETVIDARYDTNRSGIDVGVKPDASFILSTMAASVMSYRTPAAS